MPEAFHCLAPCGTTHTADSCGLWGEIERISYWHVLIAPRQLFKIHIELFELTFKSLYESWVAQSTGRTGWRSWATQPLDMTRDGILRRSVRRRVPGSASRSSILSARFLYEFLYEFGDFQNGCQDLQTARHVVPLHTKSDLGHPGACVEDGMPAPTGTPLPALGIHIEIHIEKIKISI